MRGDAGERWRWGVAWGVLLGFSLLGTAWLGLRRGEVSLFVVNKAIACSGLLGLVLAVLAGRLRWPRPMGRPPARELGLAATGVTAVHVVVSLVALPERFPFPEWYLDEAVATITGAVAFGLLVRRAWHSRGPGVSVRRPRRSGVVLRWILPLAIVHMLWLKVPGWVRWAGEGSTWMPPWSLLVAVGIGALWASVRWRHAGATRRAAAS